MSAGVTLIVRLADFEWHRWRYGHSRVVSRCRQKCGETHTHTHTEREREREREREDRERERRLNLTKRARSGELTVMARVGISQLAAVNSSSRATVSRFKLQVANALSPSLVSSRPHPSAQTPFRHSRASSTRVVESSSALLIASIFQSSSSSSPRVCVRLHTVSLASAPPPAFYYFP